MIFMFGKYFLDYDQESLKCALKDEAGEEMESKTDTRTVIPKAETELGAEISEEIIIIRKTKFFDKIRSSTWYSKFKIFAEKFFTPPINATFLAIFISEVKPIQRFLFQSNHEVFTVLSSTISEIGHASIPVNLFVLGSDLSHGPDKGILEYRQIICTVINKQVLLPAFILSVMSFFRYKTTLFGEDQSAVMFIILLESCMPPAVGLSILSQVNGFGQKEVSSMLFYHYLSSLVTSTIWITIFLAWI
jgi:predicted permease